MTQIISQHISENWLSREEMTAYFCAKTGKCPWFFLGGEGGHCSVRIIMNPYGVMTLTQYLDLT